jgi:hypothetical protein
MPDVGCSGIPNVFTNLDEAAHMAGVERIELLGALNQIEFDTGRQVQPKDYLYSTGQLERPYDPAEHVTARAAPSARWAGTLWCESRNNWHANTGNGYYGGLQEDMQFWRNYGYASRPGGPLMAPRPDLATPEQQMLAADRGLAAQGPGAWPHCRP